MIRIAHPAFAEAMADLRSLGVEESREGAPFGLFAARSNARWWLLPVSSGRQARAGLDLFQPVSSVARAMKLGAATACALGLQRVVFRTTLRLSGVDRLAAAFPGDAATSLAVFTGTDGPHRKTAIQFVDRKARILGYGKLSRSPRVIPWIDAEAQRLEEVAALRLESAEVPQRLDLRRNDGSVLLLTDSRKSGGFRIPRALGAPHAAFLTEIAARTAGPDWPDHLGRLRDRFGTVRPVMGPGWQARIGGALDRLVSGPTLPVVLAHGDFTPWNGFLGDRLYVFDWEYAGRRAVGHDAAHFTLATHPSLDAPALEAAALAALAAHHPGLDPVAARQALLAYLCDQTLLFALREHEGLRRMDGWADAPRLAPLIDRLLER